MNNSCSWNLENNSKIRMQHDIGIVLFLFMWNWTCVDAAINEKLPSDYNELPKVKASDEHIHSDVTSIDGVQEGPYAKGGMPLISDSLFSLVILIYVSVAFLFMFFMFCWKNGNSVSADGTNNKGTNVDLKCPLMSLEDIIGGKRQQDKPQDIMMDVIKVDLDDDFGIR